MQAGACSEHYVVAHEHYIIALDLEHPCRSMFQGPSQSLQVVNHRLRLVVGNCDRPYSDNHIGTMGEVPTAPLPYPFQSPAIGTFESGCASIYIRSQLRGRLLQDWVWANYCSQNLAVLPCFDDAGRLVVFCVYSYRLCSDWQLGLACSYLLWLRRAMFNRYYFHSV